MRDRRDDSDGHVRYPDEMDFFSHNSVLAGLQASDIGAICLDTTCCTVVALDGGKVAERKGSSRAQRPFPIQ